MLGGGITAISVSRVCSSVTQLSRFLFAVSQVLFLREVP